jgi:hypothetical protein
MMHSLILIAVNLTETWAEILAKITSILGDCKARERYFGLDDRVCLFFSLNLVRTDVPISEIGSKKWPEARPLRNFD